MYTAGTRQRRKYAVYPWLSHRRITIENILSSFCRVPRRHCTAYGQMPAELSADAPCNRSLNDFVSVVGTNQALDHPSLFRLSQAGHSYCMVEVSKLDFECRKIGVIDTLVVVVESPLWLVTPIIELNLLHSHH